MDDATTAFATACAVIAASTGMVLCFAPKNVNDAVVDDEPVTNEEKKAATEEPAETPPTTTTEVPTKEEITEPVLSEETITEPPKEEETVAPIVNEDVPEQRPIDTTATTTTTPKKRRFIRDRSNRVVEPKSQKVKNNTPRKWLWQRPNKNNSSSVHVGQEV